MSTAALAWRQYRFERRMFWRNPSAAFFNFLLPLLLLVLAAVASVLPLKHVIDGLHGAIITGTGLGHHVQALVVLLAWSAGGIFLAVRYFRWE